MPQSGLGLDRVDQHSLRLNGSASDPYTGAGLNSYVVDTGVAVRRKAVPTVMSANLAVVVEVVSARRALANSSAADAVAMRPSLVVVSPPTRDGDASVARTP